MEKQRVEKMMNFSQGVLAHRKFQYQEGQENDVQFICANGIVTVRMQKMNYKNPKKYFY